MWQPVLALSSLLLVAIVSATPKYLDPRVVYSLGRVEGAFANFSSTDYTECLAECNKEDSCILFSFDTESKQCYLKSSWEGAVSRDAKYISGYSRWETDPCVLPYTAIHSKEYNSSKVDITTASHRECQELCAKRPACIVAYYDRRGEVCTLWSSAEYRFPLPATAYVSIPKHCGRVPGHDVCFDYELEYRGDSIQTLSDIGSPSVCQQKCTETEGCKYFSLQLSSGKCYLKETPGILRATVDFVSGPAICWGGTSCYEYDIEYKDFNLTDAAITTENIMECQKLCASHEVCRSFSFRNQDNQCQLKWGYGFRYPVLGVTSGPHDCSSRCVEKDSEFEGEEVRTVKVPDYEKCKDACFHEWQCHYWTYGPGDASCRLLKEFMYRRTTRGAVSGFRQCQFERSS